MNESRSDLRARFHEVAGTRVYGSPAEFSAAFAALTRCIQAVPALTLFAACAVCASENSLPYYDTREFTPRWLDANSPQLEDFHRIPDFSFTNQEGRRITEEDVAHGVYVASFFFSTCPGICPMVRSKLAAVQERFIDDENVTILSHSIRPGTDTVEVLRAYAELHGVRSGKWHLLTGDRNTIYTLAREAYFADEDLGSPTEDSDFLHTENLLLIDGDRHIRGIYNGLSSSSVQHLIADIEALTGSKSSRPATRNTP